MKKIPIYLSIPLVLLIIGIGAEWLNDEQTIPEFLDNPWVLLFMMALLLVMLSLYAVNKAMKAIIYLNNPEKAVEEQEEEEEPEEDFAKTILQKLTDAKPVEKEKDILLDHNYDGIKELDNNLPPWWVYGFYISILFSVIYLLHYHVLGTGELSEEEYQSQLVEAEEEKAAYIARMGALVDETNVTLLTAEADLGIGKEIFIEKCAACHRTDGGGNVGPNLTDDYWIAGGAIQDLFKTIKYGGRPGKGMISWKSQLKPLQMQQVASYILSLQGTEPSDPKAPEGKQYIPETTSIPDSTAVPADSTNEGIE